MKKLVLTCSALLALVAFSAPNADAQVCLKFTQFCDGIQINSSNGGNVSADWYHFDCANSTAMTSGFRGKNADVYSDACGGGGVALINCTNCGGFGDWHFVIDNLNDGSIDMVSGQYPGGSCWIDELGISVQIGPCTGLKLKGDSQKEQRSTVQ